MKTLRVAICIVLIVGVLAMSLSVFAVDFTDRVNSYEYLWAYYIYQFLSSIGIDVTYRDIVGYTDEVQDTIIDWVVNYIADLIEADSQPSNYTIAQWVAPWQAEYDYWGNLKYNSTMLEDMQDFAEWLKQKFSLVDNTTVVINPVITLGNYQLYEPNKVYIAARYPNGTPLGIYLSLQITTQAPYYFIYTLTDYDAGMPYFCLLNNPLDQAFSITGEGNALRFSDDLNTWSLATTVSSGNSATTFRGYTTGTTQYMSSSMNRQIPQDANVWVGTRREFAAFLANAELNIEGDVKFVTSNIVLPEDNPSYTPGDGMTIIDGVPEYSVINIDNVTVDNLPAIITQGKIPDVSNDEENPGFSVPWQAINGLIQYVAAPAGAIMALVNEAPVEGVIMLYALIGGIIIFGMIRIMREH